MYNLIVNLWFYIFWKELLVVLEVFCYGDEEFFKIYLGNQLVNYKYLFLQIVYDGMINFFNVIML